LQSQIDSLQEQLDAVRAEHQEDDVDHDGYCGKVTGWARGWYHRGHKHGH